MTAPKLSLLVYRLPPQQQITMFRIFPAIGYYMIGKPTRGLLMFFAMYPVLVACQSVTDTLAVDLGWNPLVAVIVGIIMYWSWNYFVMWDVARRAKAIKDEYNSIE